MACTADWPLSVMMRSAADRPLAAECQISISTMMPSSLGDPPGQESRLPFQPVVNVCIGLDEIFAGISSELEGRDLDCLSHLASCCSHCRGTSHRFRPAADGRCDRCLPGSVGPMFVLAPWGGR